MFRENKDRKVYGLTFIDNKKGAVFNGSDHGKEYSGQALLKRFDNWTAGEKERQHRVDQGLEWPQFEKYDHSQANWMHDITIEFLDLMKSEKYDPEPNNPYLKKRNKRKRRLY
jgi:hypothetical protein